MRKFKIYFDKDKETVWLNEMAAQGYAMTGFFAGVYTFDQCEPGRYIYQVDFSDQFGHVSENYREFMNEMGVEIIQSWGYWVILRKEAEAGPFELYTDVDSQLEHYKKIQRMFQVVTIVEMLCLFIVSSSVAMAEEPYAWLLVLPIFVIVFALAKATLQTGEMIRILKERKTGIEEEPSKMSAVLMSGLLLNLVRMAAGASLPDWAGISLSLIAIVLMLIGIAQVARQK